MTRTIKTAGIAALVALLTLGVTSTATADGDATSSGATGCCRMVMR